LGALLSGASLFSAAVRSLVSALLFAPPVLLAMDVYGRRWMALINNEPLVEHRFDLDSLLPTDNEQTMALPLLARTEARRLRLIGAGYVTGAAVLAVLVAGFFPAAEPWVPLLFLVPMLWAASARGLRGALLATSLGSLLCVLGLAWTAAAPRPAELWSTRPDLLILSLAAALVGRAHERESKLLAELADRNRLLRRDLLRVAEALTHAVETKDTYTEGHLRRVSQYAVAVGEKLGVRGQELEQLYVASMLHDVGKLGVPEHVLHKDGPLDPHEEEIMRRHPEIGAKLLEKLELLGDVAPLVLHHQERFDGKRQGTNPGYPRGLAGEEIPLGARVIAVVDAYDAMTTSRPYREALSVDDATATLRRERGRQFDPTVVDAFLDCLVERPWRIH
jgi:HD-GYP domain-containing protein (c-di-GMP phosphodiesterase class II)